MDYDSYVYQSYVMSHLAIINYGSVIYNRKMEIQMIMGFHTGIDSLHAIYTRNCSKCDLNLFTNRLKRISKMVFRCWKFCRTSIDEVFMWPTISKSCRSLRRSICWWRWSWVRIFEWYRNRWTWTKFCQFGNARIKMFRKRFQRLIDVGDGCWRRFILATDVDDGFFTLESPTWRIKFSKSL